ncbi:MAG: hypothetical protein IJV85_04490 [Clostridia bacterium]|nr:hypothetical protein [Clostridia bacterium]
MKNYEHFREFPIKYCDVDFKDELKPSIALSYMQEVACSSADELGFGYSYVKPRGYAFMVSNISCEFLTPITLGERIKVKTWPTPPTYVVFGREYQFLSESGEERIRASSRWCMIEYATGKLMQSKTLDNQDYSTYNTAKALEDPQWKISPFDPSEGELKFTIKIANSEYDHNMHVNNTRYADYCFNCFSVEELALLKLKRFSIAYVKQAKENDVLSFYRKKTEDGSYLAHGFNEKGEAVVRSEIVFEK